MGRRGPGRVCRVCSRSLGTESPYVQLLAAPSVECLMPSRMRSETNFVLPTRFETRILLGCYSSAYYSSARALRSASGSRLGKMPCRDSPSMCARELWAVWPPVNVVTALYKYRKRSVQAGRIVSPTSYLLSTLCTRLFAPRQVIGNLSDTVCALRSLLMPCPRRCKSTRLA